jgi:SAM-dependent methyltransferase
MYEADLAHIHHEGFSEFAEAASAWIVSILPPRGLVVDIGCGSGVLARALTDAGFEVLGFDVSRAMIALARKTAPRADFKVARFAEVCGAGAPPASRGAPRAAVRAPGKVPGAGRAGRPLHHVDAIVAIGEVLNYGTFDEVRAFIANAAQTLRTGGVLLFDIAERGSYPPHDEVRTGGEDWSVIAIKDSDGARLTRRVLTFREIGEDVRRTEEVHELELYERAAMLSLLQPHFNVRVRRSYGTRRLPKGHAVYHATKR